MPRYPRLGSWELEVLARLRGGEVATSIVKEEICRESNSKYCEDMVKRAIRSLKRKGIIKARRYGRWKISLTRRGRAILSELCSNILGD